MDTESSGTIELAALGRPFSLGMLYDCRRDQLIPGLTLWDYEDLKNDIRRIPQPNTEFDLVTSESLEDKTSSLNVEASLTVSFLAGLVDVGGSAKYLKDNKASQNQARVTLKYKTTTEFRQLSMNTLGRGNVKHEDVFASGVATHVVTGILYGAQAFFVFDHEVSDEEKRKDIEASLKAGIKKIPMVNIGGDVSVKDEDKDITKAEALSCKFHGDFSLQKNPVSFKDAIEVYQSLPGLLGPKGENAVPVTVSLMPLTVLDASAAQLVCQISSGLVHEAESVIEDFGELELRCKDALKSPIAQQFPQIGKNLTDFQDLCEEYKLVFQNTLAEKLPSIRGGKEDESVLAEALKRRHSSPFDNKNLSDWMRCKEREIIVMSSLTMTMAKTQIVASQNEFEKMIFSPETRHAVCFAFTSLETAEPYLSALSSYLRDTPKQVKTQDTALPTDEWYFSETVFNSMREKAKLFVDFAEANQNNTKMQFLTTAIPNETQKGASIYLYKDGFVVNDNFEPPSKPETPTASDITHNSVTLKMCPPRFGAEGINQYFIEYCVTGQDDWQQETVPKADEVTVSKLTPNTEYKFKYEAMCPLGRGPASEVSESIKTRPTSPPKDPKVEAHAKKLSVKWKKPTELGDKVKVESYSVEYTKESPGMKTEQLEWKKVTSKDEKETITGLEPMTKYVVRVRCECGVAGSSKESIEVTVQTCK